MCVLALMKSLSCSRLTYRREPIMTCAISPRLISSYADGAAPKFSKLVTDLHLFDYVQEHLAGAVRTVDDIVSLGPDTAAC
ncbi:hypothetical protein XF36_06235 [Pseudonocardia sp. HH130629-09]|nr:hypothetical protein XF36_06235 [Pseudonocardia sp. HH130629-09]